MKPVAPVTKMRKAPASSSIPKESAQSGLLRHEPPAKIQGGVEVDGLAEVGGEAFLGGALLVALVGAGGNRHGRHVAQHRLSTNGLQQIVAVHQWHGDVQEKDVRRPRRNQVEHFLSATCGSHDRPVLGHQMRQHIEIVDVIIRYQHFDPVEDFGHAIAHNTLAAHNREAPPLPSALPFCRRAPGGTGARGSLDATRRRLRPCRASSKTSSYCSIDSSSSTMTRPKPARPRSRSSWIRATRSTSPPPSQTTGATSTTSRSSCETWGVRPPPTGIVARSRRGARL